MCIACCTVELNCWNSDIDLCTSGCSLYNTANFSRYKHQSFKSTEYKIWKEQNQLLFFHFRVLSKIGLKKENQSSVNIFTQFNELHELIT